MLNLKLKLKYTKRSKNIQEKTITIKTGRTFSTDNCNYDYLLVRGCGVLVKEKKWETITKLYTNDLSKSNIILSMYLNKWITILIQIINHFCMHSSINTTWISFATFGIYLHAQLQNLQVNTECLQMSSIHSFCFGWVGQGCLTNQKGHIFLDKR